MLEKLVLSRVENLEVYGLLIKGGVLENYLMDLKVDGIYRYIKLDTLNLVNDFTKMINMMRSLPTLHQ